MTAAGSSGPQSPTDWRPGDGRAAPAWRATLTQAGMELRLTSRRGENLLVTIVIPVALLLFFGAVPGPLTTVDQYVDPIALLVPGILALAIISTSFVNLGIATAYERSYGVLKRLGGSPLPRGGLIAAKMLTVLVVEVVQFALIVVIAATFFAWAPGLASWPVVIAGLVLGTVTFAGLGLLMAGALRAEATLAGANGLYLVFLLLGGILVPVDRLPGVLADLGRVLPSAALSDALRIGFGAATGDALGPLAILAAWGLIAVGLAVRTFRWE